MHRCSTAYADGPEAVVVLVVTLMSALAAQVETVAAQVTALEGEQATLRTENATLRAKLETTSRNSGKPPSSDGPGIKPHPKSQRVGGRRVAKWGTWGTASRSSARPMRCRCMSPRSVPAVGRAWRVSPRSTGSGGRWWTSPPCGRG